MAVVGKHVIFQNTNLVLSFTVKDKAKVAVAISKARFVLVLDPDTMTSLTWDKQITTTLTVDGQITDAANGVGVFYATKTETGALTRKHKAGFYTGFIVVRRTSDSKDFTGYEAEFYVRPGVDAGT